MLVSPTFLSSYGSHYAALASLYTAGDGTLTVQTGQGARFLPPGAANWPEGGVMWVLLGNGTIRKVTDVSGDVLTLAAGAQDGSTDANAAAGTTVDVVIGDAALKEHYAADLLSPDRGVGQFAYARGKKVSVSAGATQTLLSYSSGPGYVVGFDYLGLENSSGSYSAGWELIITVDGTVIFDGAQSLWFGALYWEDGYTPQFWNALTMYGGRGFRSQIPIPFSTSILIQIKNNGTGAKNAWWAIPYVTGLANLWPRTRNLHVALANPPTLGTVPDAYIVANPYDTVTLVDASSLQPGRLLGVVMGWETAAFGRSAGTGGLLALEGTVDVYVDGTQVMQSSGTEDFFGIADYFGGVSNGFSSPSITLNRKFATSLMATRLFLLDKITFQNALKIQWHAGDAAYATWTGQIAFYYAVLYYTE